MTGDLAVWLRAQLDADEKTARDAAGREGAEEWAWFDSETDEQITGPSYEDVICGSLRSIAELRPSVLGGFLPEFITSSGGDPEITWAGAQHIARHDPAFTLADITAKRAIIDLHALTETDWYGPMERECVACWSAPYPCTTLRLLAQPYAGRPGWHNEWTTT